MKKLFYKPENAWVGDLIPYYDNGTYYAFYLHDPRIYQDEFAEETTWHLVTTNNFADVEYQGEAIAKGGTDRPNRNAYTGSIIKDQGGLYHAFYTAYNADIKINGKSVQSVMKAVGSDLLHLKTVEDFLYVADGVRYEEFDWRDPYVFWNESEQCYYMLLAAREKGGGELRGGCISLSKSDDLVNWSYAEPFYAPRMYITMECPEVFRMGDYWYLVFSTFSDRFTTHYRYAEDLSGPWMIPADDGFDTRANYAIKTASDGERRYAFGWIASKRGNSDFGPWEWGGTMVFHEIVQQPETGFLTVKPTAGMKNYYRQDIECSSPVFYNCEGSQEKITSETLGALLYDIPKDCFAIECEFRVEQAHEFGLALHTDSGMEKGYFLRMDRQAGQMAWDMWPRTVKGKYQWQIDGDVPFQVETMRKLPSLERYKVFIVREEDICVVYVNDEIALSTRMYNHKGGKFGFYVIQGTMESIDVSIKIMEGKL